jgi:hypothetical protein
MSPRNVRNSRRQIQRHALLSGMSLKGRMLVMKDAVRHRPRLTLAAGPTRGRKRKRPAQKGGAQVATMAAAPGKGSRLARGDYYVILLNLLSVFLYYHHAVESWV